MSEWIKCDEQMPEPQVKVLAFTAYGVWVAFYSKKYDCWDDGDWNDSLDSVTHWMPLPEPPEE